MSVNEDRPSRAARWHGWSHADTPILISLMILGWTPLADTWPATLVLVVGLVWSQYSGYQHASGLCSRCVTAIPLDGTAAAQRRHRLLRFHHHMENNWDKKPTTRKIAMFFLIFFLAILASSGISTLFDSVESDALLATLFLMPLAVANLATRSHHVLVPWCPYCWRIGEEEGHTSPTPQPQSGASD